MSGGESTSITTSDSTSVNTLPVASGRKLSRVWTSPRSELARDTIWPVGSWSWRAKSSRWRCSKSAVRRSCCTSNAKRPPTKRRTNESPKLRAPSTTSSVSRGQSACVAVDDDAVDHRAFDEGHGDGDERGAQRNAQGDEHLAPVPGEERPEPADPAALLDRASFHERHAQRHAARSWRSSRPAASAASARRTSSGRSTCRARRRGGRASPPRLCAAPTARCSRG